MIQVTIKKKEIIRLEVFDTGGDELNSGDRWRDVQKIKPDVFMLVFSIDNRTSFENL